MMKSQQDITESEKLKKEIEIWRGKYLRALADYQNLEKRVAQERERYVKFASENIIKGLLVVFDTLEKAALHLKDKGLTLGVKSFWELLSGNGVRKIDVLRRKFNPQEMECVEVVKSNNEDEVIEEVRAGYKLWDRVIRIAQVKVGKKQIDHKTEDLAKQELQKGNYM